MCASRADVAPRLAPALIALLGLLLLPGLAAAATLLQLFARPLSPGVALHGLVLAGLLLAALLPILPDLLRAEAPPRALRALSAAALASQQLALLCFYALAAAGQHYWGNWINLELALAYLPQLPELLRALERSPAWLAVAAALLGLAWLGLWRLYAGLLARLAAARAARPRSAMATGLLLLVGLVAALMLLQASYGRDHALWAPEPLQQAARSASFGNAGRGIALSPAQLQLDQRAAADYPPRPATGPARPLVLIIVDAMRSDLMGVYGSPVANTPFLSRLQAEGRLQRVENAYSVCTVSYCGILGVLAAKPWHQLTPRPLGLADALKRLGYDSRFILSGDHTSFFGLRKMYGDGPSLVLDGSDQRRRYANDDRLVLDALDARGWPRDKPGFLYVHLMSAHRLGRLDDAFKRWGAADALNYSRFEPVDPKDYPDARARYHNGILQADDMIRAIFERLQRWGVLDDAIVVITADHGDMIGELGRWSHGQPPYEPVVRIPLLVYDRQAREPLPARRLVSQVDIAPTLLQAIGAPIPSSWPGVPLQLPQQREVLGMASERTAAVVLDDGQARYKYMKVLRTGRELLFRLRPEGGDEAHDLSGEADNAVLMQRLRRAYAEQGLP